MRIFDIIRSANANLARNKIRTVLTIIAIFVGAFTLALTTGIDTGVNRYIDAQLGNVGGENTLIIYPKTPDMTQDNNKVMEYQPKTDQSLSANPSSAVSMPKPISKQALQKIKDLDGIKDANFYTMPEVDFITSQETDKKFVISLSEAIPGITVDMETGQTPSIESDRSEISLEPRFVETLGFKDPKQAVGQKVTLGVTSALTGEQKVFEATVVGVQSQSLISDGYSNVNPALSTVITTSSETDTLKSPTQHYSATAILKDDLSKDQIANIKNEISDLGYDAKTVDDQIGMVRSIITAITAVLTMFGAIALLAASFGIINTLYMAVQERTREIGLMKAMGLSNGKVFTLFSIEAILIGFWGSVLGIGVAMLAGYGINIIAKDSFLGDLTGFTLIQFSWQNILIIIGTICLIAFLAGTMPAVRASKLNPIEALRYE